MGIVRGVLLATGITALVCLVIVASVLLTWGAITLGIYLWSQGFWGQIAASALLVVCFALSTLDWKRGN